MQIEALLRGSCWRKGLQFLGLPPGTDARRQGYRLAVDLLTETLMEARVAGYDNLAGEAGAVYLTCLYQRG